MKIRRFCVAAMLVLVMGTIFSFQQSSRTDLNAQSNSTTDETSDMLISGTGQTIWNKTLGTADGETPLEIIEAQNGGYFILYQDQDINTGDCNASLMRIDLNGNHVWNRTIHETIKQQYPSLTQTQDGGFTILTNYKNTTTNNVSIYLVHLDSEGDQVWNKTLHLEIADYGVQIIESTSGDYYLACHNFLHYNETTWFTASMLVRTDNTGSLIWKRVYTPGWQTNSIDLVESGGGDIIVLAEFHQPSIDTDFWIYSVDSNGNHNWNYTFDQSNDDIPLDIALSSTGGFLIGGYTVIGASVEAVLLHLDESGSFSWDMYYSFNYAAIIDDLIVSSDGSLTFVGTIITESLEYMALLVHLNATGHMLWNETFGNSEYYMGRSIVEVSSEVYVIAVSVTDSQPSYPPFDMWIAKVAKPMSGLTSEDQIHEADAWFNYDLDAYSVLGIDTWWLNDTTNFMIDVDGLIQNATILPGGVHGLEVSVNDTGGRVLTTTFSVTVIDTRAPTWLVPPSDQFAEYGVHFVYDVDAADVSGISAYWVDNPSFTIDSSGVILNATSLFLGDYPVTISVNDTSGNEISVEITIRVRDSTNPLPDDLPDMNYEVGGSGFWLHWSCVELLPESVELLLDGLSLGTLNWTGFDIDYFVEGLELGIYNYTVVYVDTSGNSGFDTVIVYAVDTTAPTVNSPFDIWYLEGIGGGFIEWHPEDLHPYTYSIYFNGIQVQTGGWSEASVMLPVSSLLPGTYNYTIVIFDTSGNYVLDTVFVTVEGLELTTTTTITTTTTSTTTTNIVTTQTSPTTTNPTTIQQAIRNLFGQIGFLTIGVVIAGCMSIISIALVIYLIKKPTG